MILDSQYFPPVIVFKKIITSTHVEIEQYESFRKGTFRNRCMISGGNGIMSLTVPILGGRTQKLAIKDIQIDYSESWQRAHSRGLATSYSKSPFYHYYKPEIEKLIFSDTPYLFDLNQRILEAMVRLLKIKVEIARTSEYIKEYEGVPDYRNKPSTRDFQSDPENTTLPYAQVFQDRFGFQPNLSILDLLFCEGPNASSFLRG